MARTKIMPPGSSAVKPPVLEVPPAIRALMTAETLKSPLGKVENPASSPSEDREAEIRAKQDEAVAKATARAAASAAPVNVVEEAQRSLGQGFFGPGTPPFPDLKVPITVKQDFRDQDPNRVSAVFREDLKGSTTAGEASSNGSAKPTTVPERSDEPRPNGGSRYAHAPIASSCEGEEVSVTRGEEHYGKPGSFSSFCVGPFSAKTRVLPGETRAQACARVLDELREVASAERERALVEFLSHFAKVVAG